MILLNLSVIIELLREAPEPQVIKWADDQPLESLFISAITVAELRAGIARISVGKQCTAIQSSLEKRLLPLFAGRILPFDSSCIQAYSDLALKTCMAGVKISPTEGYIAATAATHGLTLATKGTRHFEATGVTIIDPWKE